MPKNENSLLKLQEKYFACHTRGKGWNVLNAHTNNIVYPNRVFSQIGARALSESLNNRLNQCKEWEDAESK
jgi:hypothetical protein